MGVVLMRRLPKDGRYPDFPWSDEDSEYTPSKTTVILAKVIFVMAIMVILLGLAGLLLLMANGIRQLGTM